MAASCYKEGTEHNATELQTMEKLYTIAGVARVEGVLTYRFASGSASARTGVLRRAGYTEIQFWELPTAMNMDEAQAWLEAQGVRAVRPTGQRRGENGGTVRAIPVQAPQHDAHVRTHREWQEAEAKKKADFVARMAAARAAKRLLKAAAQQEEAEEA